MPTKILRTLLCLAIITPALTRAATAQDTAAHAIITVLNKSADDWNRGDLDAFATSYKNSPDILFMGRTIQHGYAQMLTHYKAAYASREKMGTLSFTQLEVQPLDERIATVTGNFHLERTIAGGSNADGYFLLVVERTPGGWKIVRDDTTALPPPPAK
jgi:ketosteroid isomerase-like protein